MTVIWEIVRASKKSSEMGGPHKQLRETQTPLREPVGRVPEPAGKTSEPAAKAFDPAGRAS